VTRPTRARRFALPSEPQSHEVPLATSPTAQHGATGAMLPLRSAAGSALAVLVKGADPALMAPKARLIELGQILEIGYRRHVLSLQKSLAGPADLEAQCDREQ